MPCSNHKTCGCRCIRELCKHWSPSKFSKYFYCNYWFSYKASCPFQAINHADCVSKKCQYLEEKCESAGKPNLTGIDWSNKEARAKYYRNKYAQKRGEK